MRNRGQEGADKGSKRSLVMYTCETMRYNSLGRAPSLYLMQRISAVAVGAAANGQVPDSLAAGLEVGPSRLSLIATFSSMLGM